MVGAGRRRQAGEALIRKPLKELLCRLTTRSLRRCIDRVVNCERHHEAQSNETAVYMKGRDEVLPGSARTAPGPSDVTHAHNPYSLSLR